MLFTPRNASSVLAALLLGLAPVACGPESDTVREEFQDVASPPGMQPRDFSGTYEVSGITVEKQSGSEREISGTITLAHEGDRYTSSFDLKTILPSPDGPRHTDVIGKGEGRVEGESLRGTAHTQLVMARVPGVDPGFAFAPRMISARIVSSSVAKLEQDGTLSIEIETEPEAGQIYPPTRTTLRGSLARAGAVPN